MSGGGFQSRFPVHERQSSSNWIISRQFIVVSDVNLVSLDYFGDFSSGVFAVK